MVPLLRRCLFALLRWLFRFEAHGLEALRTPGPVLLVPNHLSWIDWLFLWVLLEDGWKFATSSTTAQTSPIHRALMLNRFTFPIDTASPFAVKRMAEFLQSGGRLVLFAEGRLSLTGSLMKLFDGTGFLFLKTKAKVITCHLRGAFTPSVKKANSCYVREQGYFYYFLILSGFFHFIEFCSMVVGWTTVRSPTA